jgi:hypothetical protein
LQVGDYDPDLTMLLATILLLAFEIVTPTQGVEQSSLLLLWWLAAC